MMTSSCDTHAHKTHHRRGGGGREGEGGGEGGGEGREGGEDSSTKIPPKQTGVRIGTNLNDTPIRSVPSH